MSDDSLMNIGEVAAAAGGAYAAYRTYNRFAPFVQGASDAFTGGTLGSLAARVAGGSTLRASIGGVAARTAGAFGARAAVGAAASGAASGAAGGSVVPGAGTLIGAAVGAVAPLIIPHTPLAGPVRRIPLIGGWLSPKQKKEKEGGGYIGYTPEKQTRWGMTTPSSEAASISVGGESHTPSGLDYVRSQRAEYQAGRGFRR